MSKKKSEELPNFYALSKLVPLWADNELETQVARTFVCEDIIGMDIENWREIDASEHLKQFLDYTEEAIDTYIESVGRCDDDTLYHMNNMKASCLSTIKVMLTYVKAHEIIRS
jgi:hypothetical protein